MKISVVGLGKLGLVMACFFASKGHEVIGVDVNEKTVGLINKKQCPILESGLDELLISVELKATTDYNEISDSEVVFILVPTPSNEDNVFINDYVLQAINQICDVPFNETPLVVIASTVMPRSCEDIILPKLQVAFGDTAKLCYNPEFVALGSVIRNMQFPDSILIGESDEKSGEILETFHRGLYEGQTIPPISRMSLCNAELAKISLNIAVTLKITLANAISDFCEEIPDGDVDVVTGFVGLDSRIGRKYLSGGLSYGGECFPRDSRAFVAFGKQIGVECPVQEAQDYANINRTVRIANRTMKILHDVEKPVISILGLTFKPDSPVTTESPAILLAEYLSDKYDVKVYDSQGMSNAMKQLDNKVQYKDTIPDCVRETDLCIVATAWDEFKTLMPHVYSKLMRTPNLLDCWRIYDRQKMIEAGVNYYAVGLNN